MVPVAGASWKGEFVGRRSRVIGTYDAKKRKEKNGDSVERRAYRLFSAMFCWFDTVFLQYLSYRLFDHDLPPFFPHKVFASTCKVAPILLYFSVE